MGKLILFAALVLSGCGYYTAPRDKRFIAELYIGMPVAELEAVAGAYRGIRLFYPTNDQAYTYDGPEEFCAYEFGPCYPKNLADSLHFERHEPIYDQHGQVISVDHHRYTLSEPSITIQMGGHRFYPPIIHMLTAYYDPSTQSIIGFKETGLLGNLSTHFPINIR